MLNSSSNIYEFWFKKDTIKRFHAVFNNYPEIELVIIYGSRAKRTFREGSDIDITLIGERLTDEIRSEIWLELDDLNTPYLIDLSLFKNISSNDLIQHIN